MVAASAKAIAEPQTTINLSYRNGYFELDTTKMFCDEDYEEATTSETDSEVILMGHEIVKLLCPALVYSKGFFKLIGMVLL